MDIDLKLTELIHKYGIDEFFPDFYLSERAISIAKEVYRQFDCVILVGTKQTDIEWFQRKICNKETKAVLFVSEDIDNKIENYRKQGVTFLVVSYYRRDEAMVKLLEKGCEAVCLYDEFEKNHIFFKGDFYDVYGEEYVQREQNELSRDFKDFDINRIFFYHRRRYEFAKNHESRKMAIKKLIFDCAYAKDFLNLKKYIEIFEEIGGEEGKKYHSFYREVEELHLEIKKVLAKRGKKDCIMIWLDALEYGEDVGMPFLGSLDEKALVFSNVYTVTPYTGATFKTLFAKIRTVEEESYKVTKIGAENSEFFNNLKRRNYKFVYYGPRDLAEREYVTQNLYMFTHSITQIYWDAIRDIVRSNSEESFFCVLHEVPHTHFPFISMGILSNQYCPRAGWPGYQPDEKFIDRQEAESKKYVDSQLKFWDEILPTEMYKIYMSDHGHTLLGRFHCILKVQHESLKPQVCKNLISWYDFDRLILDLLDNRVADAMKIQNDYCIIQDIEYYNKDVILVYIKNKEMPSTQTFLSGYQGVVTKEDLFIRYNNGIEFYQKKYNDELMVTDERLNYLREIISKKRIDIATEEKFRYSYLAQRVKERCTMRTKERQGRKLKIIRAIFEESQEGEVLALRGGGMHSLRMLMLLEEKLRRKVSYVIDRDQNCIAGKLGIKVVTMEEAGKCPLDKVIISSFDYRRAWKEECLQCFTAEVIDPYELLEQREIHCKEEFYKLEYSEEDFEEIKF